MKQWEFLIVSWALSDPTDVIDLTSNKTSFKTSGLLVRIACMTLLGKHLLAFWISLPVSSAGTTVIPLHFLVFLAQFQFLSMVTFFSHIYSESSLARRRANIHPGKCKIQEITANPIDHINSWSIRMASWKRWIYIKCVVVFLLFWIVLMT